MDVTLNNKYNSKIHPHKFALWLSMGSIIMMFGAFTSAYIVRQAAGNWLQFTIPTMFYISTGIILASSVTLHLSFIAFKKNKELIYKSCLILSFLLGIGFVIAQYQGYLALFDMGVYMKGNPSGSFFYVITAVHLAHIIGGLAALIVAMLHAFSLPFKPTAKRKIRFELVLQYWHFVDLLWIYLFVFLLLTR